MHKSKQKLLSHSDCVQMAKRTTSSMSELLFQIIHAILNLIFDSIYNAYWKMSVIGDDLYNVMHIDIR